MAEEDLTWRERLYEAVLNIGLTVRPRIAEPDITLSQLLDLEPGMVVNIPSVAGLTLYIEKQRYAAGTLGDVGGNAAVKITEIFEE
jgi:flagellar motor switch protein FliM